MDGATTIQRPGREGQKKRKRIGGAIRKQRRVVAILLGVETYLQSDSIPECGTEETTCAWEVPICASDSTRSSSLESKEGELMETGWVSGN